METEAFWQMLEDARRGVNDPMVDVDEIAEALMANLSTLATDNIVEFQEVSPSFTIRRTAGTYGRQHI